MVKTDQLKKLISLSILFLYAFSLKAQIDTEFWFAAPEVTLAHADRPIYLRISTLNEAATVIISQPANPSFSPITISISANSTRTVDLTDRIHLLENGSPDVVENKGLFIKSTSLVTAYYEVLGTSSGNVVNCDIFSLKGRNAIGKKFFTPFQNAWDNIAGIDAWSSFDIVATENGTTVTITPTQDIVGHAAGIPFTIFLNKGQTYSARATGTDKANHLSGSLITSDKPIAVTIKDDSLFMNFNYDLAGDQIIPVDLVGQEYVVIKASGSLNIDRVFICATDNNTDVFINGNPVAASTLQAGQTFTYQLNLSYEFIQASKPVYVFHVCGFSSELAGALLPPVGCTGSRHVGFTRPNYEPFALNIVVKAGGENYFKLNGRASISPSSFSTVPGSGGLWKAAHISFSSGSIVPNAPTIIKNDSAEFHLGLLNGESNTGFRYGYFSDYGVVDLGINKSICKGDSLILNGGFGMTSYEWSTGETTQYITVKDSGTYSVEIEKGTCVLKDTVDSVSIAFNPDPQKVLGTDTAVCSNLHYQIRMDTLYSRYKWLNGSTDSLFTPTFTGTYWVDVWNEYGCKTRDSIDVIVYQAPRPVISFHNDLEKICWDSTLTLDAGAGYQSYRWHSGETSRTITSPHLAEYYVVVTDQNNCTDSTNLYIDCSPYIKVFNFMTPNGDGFNDVFHIEGLKPDKWMLEIFNRWGNQIYYNRSYQNNFDAKDLPTGVYFYHLKHVEEKKMYKGWLQVIKPE